MSKETAPVPGQIRFNVFTGDVVIPPESPREDIGEFRRLPSAEEMPVCAYINTEGLRIIRNRVNEHKETVTGSDAELAKKLVVFMGGRTTIQLDPAEELRKGYKVKLNIGIIAWKTPAMDEQDIPAGHDFYQLLGVYKEYKATGRVSTDKSTRKYATIQKSNKDHPESLRVSECFFARPKDAIRVEMSKYERTGYFWKKRQSG